MLHQGEKIDFCGVFETLVGGVWTKITDLSSYTISVLITNPSSRGKLLFKTGDEAHPINTSDDGKYSFSITKEESATMYGPCHIEVALFDEDGNPVISDNTGEITIKPSLIGKELANNNELASDNE